MKPLVSIIIVNYNGYGLLTSCLDSIFLNNYSNYEIIIADNGSTDNSVSKIKKKYSSYQHKLKVLNLKKNYGPSLARNLAFKKSKGEIVAFLDNDTLVKKDWITQVIPIFKSNKNIGAVQSKLLLIEFPNRIDYVGERLGNLGFLKPIAPYGEIDYGQYDKKYPILAAKSAGMFITREAFKKSGQFDPDYFIFMEETDLGWRVWLAGYKNIFCPKSVVYHQFSSTKNIVSKDFNNYLIRFHGTKNYIQTLLKNLSLKNIIKIIPIHVFLWLSLATYLFITLKFKSSINIYRGIFWNLKNFPKIINKRTLIQKNRKISDKTLFITNKLMIKTSLYSYVKNFFESQRKISTPEN